MSTFKQGDKVVITTSNGREMVGTIVIRVVVSYQPDTTYYSVRFDNTNETHYIPEGVLRLRDSPTPTAKGIVEKLKQIEELRSQVDMAFKDIIGLLALDGQPESEKMKYQAMRVTHRTVLCRDIAAELTAWERDHEARNKL